MNKKKIIFDDGAFGAFPSDSLNHQSEEVKSDGEGFDLFGTATFDSKEWKENTESNDPWSIHPDELNNGSAVDASFDTDAFQYSAKSSDVDDDNAWASPSLFPDLFHPPFDDAFEVDPFAMPRRSPQQKVHVTVQEQLSIMFDDVSPNPSSKVTGAIYVSQTTDSF
jgi:hypothetical protein